METNIHESWQPLFQQYKFHVEQLYPNPNSNSNSNSTILNVYPPKNQLFRVFEMPIQDIQIVLLGQDPYHRKGQAHGLSFSVPIGEKIPPSLRNIFKELKLEFPEREYVFVSGNLDPWFQREKIFLLNSSLSVIEGQPGSHMKIWESFTNDVIEFISQNNPKCVFLLLGNFAKEKTQFIEDKTRIVYGVHPSPLARGFIGSNVFLQVEELLGKSIDWFNS
jgi:uracil-DNA glycosylase